MVFNFEKQSFWVQAIVMAVLVFGIDKIFRLGLVAWIKTLFAVGGALWFIILIVAMVVVLHFGEILGLLKSKGKGVRKSFSFKKR